MLGVSAEAVYAAVKTNRLSVVNGPDGRPLVNTETMREEWAKNTQTRIGMGPKSSGPGREKKPLRSKRRKNEITGGKDWKDPRVDS